jgi:hypothetical protein
VGFSVVETVEQDVVTVTAGAQVPAGNHTVSIACQRITTDRVTFSQGNLTATATG